MDRVRTDLRVCPFCEATCGLSLTLEGDRVTDVRGAADDVFSRGYLCPKVWPSASSTTTRTACASH